MTTGARNSGITAPTFHLTDRGPRLRVDVSVRPRCEHRERGSPARSPGTTLRKRWVERRAVGPDLQFDDPFRIVEIGIEAVRAAAGVRAGGSGYGMGRRHE